MSNSQPNINSESTVKQSAKKLIVVSSNNHHQPSQNFTASLVKFPDSAYANFRPINCATWTIVIHEHCLLAALLAGELKKAQKRGNVMLSAALPRRVDDVKTARDIIHSRN